MHKKAKLCLICQKTIILQMAVIVLVGCSASKSSRACEAKDMYRGTLFRSSYSYATALRPNKVLILSALYGIVHPNSIIRPYNVTLTYVSPKKRSMKPDLLVLNSYEKAEWAEKVIEQLSLEASVVHDTFIFLTGEEYILPLADKISNIEKPLSGLRIGERIKFLKDKLL